jgi:hypothetical protein
MRSEQLMEWLDLTLSLNLKMKASSLQSDLLIIAVKSKFRLAGGAGKSLMP